jgi:hypothetical protein
MVPPFPAQQPDPEQNDDDVPALLPPRNPQYHRQLVGRACACDVCADEYVDVNEGVDGGVRVCGRVVEGEEGNARKLWRVAAVVELVEMRVPRGYECDVGGWGTEPW